MENINETSSQDKSAIHIFCSNTNIPACEYLIRRSNFERLFWITYLLAGIVGIVLLTEYLLLTWSTESVFITLDSSSRSVTEVDFPGVAICNINKISRHRAEEFSKTLNFIDDPIERLKLIRIFGNLYDQEMYGIDNFTNFQLALDKYDYLSEDKDWSSLLLTLTTPCQESITNCSWDSVTYDCKDLFQLRLTDSGFCCVFNYVRSSFKPNLTDDIEKVQPLGKPRKFLGTGETKGLAVTMINNISDYFYTEMSTRGFLIKIFFPTDFADLASGSLRQIIVQPKSEVFLKLEANVLETQPQVRTLNKNARKCKYPDEDTTVFGVYTSSNCFVDCKMQSVLSLCNCVPSMLPLQPGVYDGERLCDLVDIPCLNKYKDKWLRYNPVDTDDLKDDLEELQLELEDSLNCNCLPNCDEITYGIDANYFEYNSDDPPLLNSSKIHLYTNQAYTNLYTKMVSVTWYEALSTFGGIVSLLMGISIVSLVEIGVVILKLVISGLKKCLVSS